MFGIHYTDKLFVVLLHRTWLVFSRVLHVKNDTLLVNCYSQSKYCEGKRQCRKGHLIIALNTRYLCYLVLYMPYSVLLVVTYHSCPEYASSLFPFLLPPWDCVCSQSSLWPIYACPLFHFTLPSSQCIFLLRNAYVLVLAQSSQKHT